jgi:hypothetical protein
MLDGLGTAILGIIEEGKEVMDDYEDSPSLDAGLLSSAQSVEHYRNLMVRNPCVRGPRNSAIPMQSLCLRLL